MYLYETTLNSVDIINQQDQTQFGAVINWHTSPFSSLLFSKGVITSFCKETSGSLNLCYLDTKTAVTKLMLTLVFHLTP